MPMFQGSPLPNKTPMMELTDIGFSKGSSSSNSDDLERQTPDTIPFAKTPKFSSTKPNLFDRDLPFRYALDDYFLSEIDTAWSDLPLIACGYVSGLIDALSYNAWGNFSNMHTGNTIFIALGVSGKPDGQPMLWLKALVAVIVFIVGNVFFVYGSRYMGTLRRSTLIVSFAIQTALLLGAALLVQKQIVSPTLDRQIPIDWLQVLTISLIAFQAAGQIVASRFLAFSEIPTVVLTVMVCDLFVDTELYRRPWNSNPKRNRRLGALLSHFLGAVTAGGMAKETGLASGLWLATALKACITLGWFVWRRKD
ncbi:unnamed protein product [Penicillium nalgiovense]|uniref:DUF1275 domain protein n=1 Tax=Penicillium nalgiovense TaxID=60175 RepID=A0A1V6XTJ5_PENNA|nr:hypothetical protein PENNAL_c0056G00039 [Penicillium nalgiovense]CAG8017033.1 unnamed protein product [Penicillium nalgiovense]CAG8040869.1 unnamed protein product [Penicillium nalgiovense]CAG8042068.1 unnamed protein product [Penicillium nalgiovense]CAG8043028.1 unnamed protein product [Penicillium nalgiovense]